MSNVIGNYARQRDDNDDMYKAILSRLETTLMTCYDLKGARFVIL